MNKTNCLLSILISTLIWQSSSAQQAINPDKAPATRGQIPYQRFKTDGESIFLVQLVQQKDAKPVEIKRTRLVPEKTDKGIEYRKVIETILTPALKEKLVRVSQQYVFQDLSGKKIPHPEMIKKLGMGNGKLIVSLMPGQTMPESWKMLLAKDTVLFSIDPSKKEK